MLNRRPKVQLGVVDFQDGAVFINGVLLPLSKIKVGVKTYKDIGRAAIWARRKRWPFGRVTNPILYNPPEEIHEGWGNGHVHNEEEHNEKS